MNTAIPASVRTVARVWDAAPYFGAVDWGEIARAGPHSGLSGGEIWRIPAASGTWGVRRWPAEFSGERLEQVHHLLRGLSESGLPLAFPIRFRAGASWLALDGSLWQVEPWLPGMADFHRDPLPEKLAAACKFLANFHLAMAAAHGVRHTVPPAVLRRIAALRQHQSAEAEYAAALARPQTPRAQCAAEIWNLAREFLPACAGRLQAAAGEPLVLLPCLRDIWHDHLLFSGAALTGVVDYGALDFDTPATDLARLLGSLVRDAADRRAVGLAAYNAVRPLTPGELPLIDDLDLSGVVIAGLNWVRWLFVEQRSFANPAAVDERLAEIALRLKTETFRQALAPPTTR